MGAKKDKIKISKLKFNMELPLSYQLKEHILGMIRTGAIKTGDKLPTVYEMAEQVGVSGATTRKAVSELAREGYVTCTPSLGTFVIDRTGSQKKADLHPAKNIGIVFPQMTQNLFDAEKSPWTWTILASIQETLSDYGYFCTFFPMAGSLHKAKEIILGNSNHFSGLISYPDYENSGFLKIFEESSKPYVLIRKWGEDINHNYVSCDDFDIGRKAARHLVEAGCRSFLILGPLLDNYYPDVCESTGFQTELIKLGIDMSCVGMCKDEDPERIAKSILNPLPCGIFATRELLAIKMLKVLRRHGRKIPEEICIMGNAGTLMCRYTHPTLTAAHQPMREIGRHASLNLLKLIRNNSKYTNGIELTGELVIRESTGREMKAPRPSVTTAPV